MLFQEAWCQAFKHLGGVRLSNIWISETQKGKLTTCVSKNLSASKIKSFLTVKTFTKMRAKLQTTPASRFPSVSLMKIHKKHLTFGIWFEVVWELTSLNEMTWWCSALFGYFFCCSQTETTWCWKTWHFWWNCACLFQRWTPRYVSVCFSVSLLEI